MRTVMVIDDSGVMRRILLNTLVAVGFEDCEFLEATDGHDALGKLEQVDFRVDVVFCDLCMPHLDGVGFLAELTSRGVVDDCPVIVLSGDIREGRGREAMEKGAKKLIGKPFVPEEIKEAMDEVLADR